MFRLVLIVAISIATFATAFVNPSRSTYSSSSLFSEKGIYINNKNNI